MNLSVFFHLVSFFPYEAFKWLWCWSDLATRLRLAIERYDSVAIYSFIGHEPVSLKFPFFQFDEKSTGDWSRPIPRIRWIIIRGIWCPIPRISNRWMGISVKQSYTRSINRQPVIGHEKSPNLMNNQLVNMMSHYPNFYSMNGNFSDTSIHQFYEEGWSRYAKKDTATCIFRLESLLIFIESLAWTQRL